MRIEKTNNIKEDELKDIKNDPDLKTMVSLWKEYTITTEPKFIKNNLDKLIPYTNTHGIAIIGKLIGTSTINHVFDITKTPKPRISRWTITNTHLEYERILKQLMQDKTLQKIKTDLDNVKQQRQALFQKWIKISQLLCDKYNVAKVAKASGINNYIFHMHINTEDNEKTTNTETKENDNSTRSKMIIENEEFLGNLQADPESLLIYNKKTGSWTQEQKEQLQEWLNITLPDTKTPPVDAAIDLWKIMQQIIKKRNINNKTVNPEELKWEAFTIWMEKKIKKESIE